MHADTVSSPASRLRLTIDAEALAANWRALNAMGGPARAGAAVKADAYGLGADGVVPVLARAGCRDWFVAHWAEAAGLLALGIPGAAIAVLHGPLDQGDCAFARATGVRPVLNSLPQVARWRESGGGPCHVMVDTGINRLGLAPADCGDPLLAGLEIDILMSHLASADADGLQNAQQLALFEQVCAALPARRRSLANSAGIALGPAWRADLTRPGIALYGGAVRDELAGVVRGVARAEACLLQVRTLSAGDRVGYNATFTAPGDMRIGIVSLGYADGYLRCWSNLGALRHGARHLPVIGRVSMDLTAIDLGAAPDLDEGDWVAIDSDLALLSRQSGLSQYEVLTLLGRRFERRLG